MKNKLVLQKILAQIDGKGYKAYNDIRGQYDFKDYILSMDSIQGDPFAAPSKGRIIISQTKARFPLDIFDKIYKNTAVCDFLTRLFSQNIYKYYNKVGGSGKSGLLIVDNPGQEILRRTSVVLDNDRLEARFEVGLPAAGRRILGKKAEIIFFDALPFIVKNTLYYNNIDQAPLNEHVALSEDQYALRRELEKRKLVAFVPNDSILPRESGVSQKPMSKNPIPFKSPKSMELELTLPNKGIIRGMAIPEGITLIVGGGYHGKSTLLEALERGVYDHICGDGREYVVTRESAVKIRAEDGRRIENVNISPFINNLPNKENTISFSTENASGSTSQAANIMEALEIGTDLLLIDEDTCATNFMIRDNKMQELVSHDKEPITPFIDRIKYMYKELGVSTILVVGSSGDYFSVADNVLMMDAYIPENVTDKAKAIVNSTPNPKNSAVNQIFYLEDIRNRILLKSSFPKGRKGVRVKTKGLNSILYNKTPIDLRYLEQLVDSSQTNCLTVIFEYILNNLVDNKSTIKEIVDRLYETIIDKGLDELSPYTGHPGNLALPRKHEIVGVLNRFRHLKVKKEIT